jgi:hypothetical protein
LLNEQFWFKNFGFQKQEVSGRKNKVSVRKTRSFGSKIPKFRFENPQFWFKTEVSVRKPTVSVQNRSFGSKIPKFRFDNPQYSFKTEVSVRKPEVSGAFFEFATSVKVVFRNASVADTRNFDLLCKFFSLFILVELLALKNRCFDEELPVD